MGMSIRQVGAAVVSGLVLLLPRIGGADDQKKPEVPKKPDSGKFLMTLKGEKAGTVTFKFDADGGSEADADLNVSGQSIKFKVSVKAKGGKTVGFGADAGEANRFTVTVDGERAKLSINGAPAESRAIPAGSMPFGNFSPHLMNTVLAAYDTKKGGAQTVNLVLAEGLPNGQLITFKAKLEGKGTKERKVDGKPLQVSDYEMTIDAAGTEVVIKLYASADRRLLAWDVPSQSYTAVREGYGELVK